MQPTTKQRGPQIKPTRADVNAAWSRLRAAVEQGSVEASALLIALTENKLVIRLDSRLFRNDQNRFSASGRPDPY